MTCREGHAPKHPDFASANVVALKHGAFSPRRVDPIAAEMVEQVTGDIDWLRDCDRPSLWAWARVEARVQLVSEYLMDRGGDIDEEGTVRPAADLLVRLESQAASLRARLGLDPLSRARLGRDVAGTQVDIAKLWASEADDHPDDAPGPRAAVQRTGTACLHGDPTCPCQDGDSCHYTGNDPSRCPTTGIVGCTRCER